MDIRLNTARIREVEIRQEARFVLWALRTAVANHHGYREARLEVLNSFRLSGIEATRHRFWRFADALAQVGWAPTVWHDPCCGCASTEEILVLQALAETRARLCNGLRGAGQKWSALVSPEHTALIDLAARGWLMALQACGVEYPRPNELITCLGSLSVLSEPAERHDVLLH
jgi:hypothetical protein